MVKKHQFSSLDIDLQASEKVYKGFFDVDRITLRHRLFGGTWSKLIKREVLSRGESVGVLLYDPKNQLIGLVEQFRIGALNDPVGPWQFEIVAGILEFGESPSEVAHRELLEVGSQLLTATVASGNVGSANTVQVDFPLS